MFLFESHVGDKMLFTRHLNRTAERLGNNFLQQKYNACTIH